MRQLTGEMLPSELMVRGTLLVKPHFSFLPLEGIVFLLQQLPQLRFEQLDAGLEMRSCSRFCLPAAPSRCVKPTRCGLLQPHTHTPLTFLASLGCRLSALGRRQFKAQAVTGTRSLAATLTPVLLACVLTSPTALPSP